MADSFAKQILHDEKYKQLRERALRTNSPLQAIRAKCWDCSGGNWEEVKRCTIEECALWAFRSGKRPRKKGAKRVHDRGDG